MKESIYAALRGEYGERVLPSVGTAYDEDHTVIVCPICNHKTLDNYDICRHCGWEYDGFPEDHYSAANGATLADYREQYKRALKERKVKMNKYYNPHPKGTTTEVGDCVKRSIVAATGMGYMEVQRELNAYKKITGAKSFNSNRNPHCYVENVLNAKQIEVCSKTTVKEFCEQHPRGRYILDMDEHWSACVDGCIYDTWDCGNEKVNFAYEITTEPYAPPNISKQVFKYCCTSERISDTETRIRIYDGNRAFVERKIPSELTKGYVLCLQHSNYQYIDLDGGKENEG